MHAAWLPVFKYKPPAYRLIWLTKAARKVRKGYMRNKTNKKEKEREKRTCWKEYFPPISFVLSSILFEKRFVRSESIREDSKEKPGRKLPGMVSIATDLTFNLRFEILLLTVWELLRCKWDPEAKNKKNKRWISQKIERRK